MKLDRIDDFSVLKRVQYDDKVRKEKKEREITDWRWDYCHLTSHSFSVVRAEILSRADRTIDKQSFYSAHDEQK